MARLGYAFLFLLAVCGERKTALLIKLTETEKCNGLRVQSTRLSCLADINTIGSMLD